MLKCFLFSPMFIEFIVFTGDNPLMQALVFDAKNTEWFSSNKSFNKDDKGYVSIKLN